MLLLSDSRVDLGKADGFGDTPEDAAAKRRLPKLAGLIRFLSKMRSSTVEGGKAKREKDEDGKEDEGMKGEDEREDVERRESEQGGEGVEDTGSEESEDYDSE